MTPASSLNRRILIIDDTPSIHGDFRKILCPRNEAADDLAQAEALLFGSPNTSERASEFELDSAYQGQEALALVEQALAAGRPYALAFIDMRMPPGWDGLQTLEHLWQVDSRLQVVLCTAYSDYSLEEMTGRVDMGDRLLILKKPFDPIEIVQMARAMTVKWQMTEEAQRKMNLLEQAVQERTRDLSDANIIVQNSPTILYRLRGQPSFPLMYISHNITKFGHQRAALLASADWTQTLIHPEDQDKVNEAMGWVLDKGAQGASIEFRLRTGSDDYRWVENRYVPVRDNSGRLLEIEGIIIDITERKQAEEKISQLARIDGLTGIANRATLMERLRYAFAAAERGAMSFAVFYLDLDHFKRINDTLGHAVGDLLLRETARRLSECTRESDLVARLGGDEFAILQLEMGDPANAAALAMKLNSRLMQPYHLDGHDLYVSSSIGISTYAPGCASAESLLSQADMALYRSKETGRNRYHFHSEDINEEVSSRITLIAELKQALIREELELYYLPEIDLQTGAILGMEALLRWHHPVRGLLDAGEFVSAAEKAGTIVAVGQWVLNQACKQMREWQQRQIAPPVISINLSLTQLKRGSEFVGEVIQTINRWQLQPSDLELDVTEATLAHTKWTHNDVLPKLRELGIKIAIDDFGTDYSSFDYLKTFRVNRLKLAPIFVTHARDDFHSAITLRTIINFANEVGIGVIAEGVETLEQRNALISTGSTVAAHGYYFSEAVNSEHAGELLAEGHINLE
ncbi:EAL domain-containing protein [Pseudomonas sp. LJDD11]|uniref:putative bifunctional diguanylate cyclase/phosphodiesterase n=1 Tax=Pseudomonas sp. LJDD11 TaxID=2931984 RepID=UPI00211CC0DB|nr:EAL domain-containing protein [Pseudomonas sp. LJDD11]MCQ9423646.1 EAL domain-containing protein [Pseudomonas sp. LJDD11]